MQVAQWLRDPQAGEGVFDGPADVAGQPAGGSPGPQGGAPGPLAAQCLAQAQALLAQADGAVELAGEAADSSQPCEAADREGRAEADLRVAGQRVLVAGARPLEIPGEEQGDPLRVGHVGAQVPVMEIVREAL